MKASIKKFLRSIGVGVPFCILIGMGCATLFSASKLEEGESYNIEIYCDKESFWTNQPEFREEYCLFLEEKVKADINKNFSSWKLQAENPDLILKIRMEYLKVGRSGGGFLAALVQPLLPFEPYANSRVQVEIWKDRKVLTQTRIKEKSILGGNHEETLKRDAAILSEAIIRLMKTGRTERKR